MTFPEFVNIYCFCQIDCVCLIFGLSPSHPSKEGDQYRFLTSVPNNKAQRNEMGHVHAASECTVHVYLGQQMTMVTAVGWLWAEELINQLQLEPQHYGMTE